MGVGKSSEKTFQGIVQYFQSERKIQKVCIAKHYLETLSLIKNFMLAIASQVVQKFLKLLSYSQLVATQIGTFWQNRKCVLQMAKHSRGETFAVFTDFVNHKYFTIKVFYLKVLMKYLYCTTMFMQLASCIAKSQLHGACQNEDTYFCSYMHGSFSLGVSLESFFSLRVLPR